MRNSVLAAEEGTFEVDVHDFVPRGLSDVGYAAIVAGHNAGIVAPPAQEGHSYQVLTRKVGDPYVGPEEWIKLAPSHEGSWWAEWTRFLVAHSGQPVAPPTQDGAEQKGAPLCDAPGSYVLEP